MKTMSRKRLFLKASFVVTSLLLLSQHGVRASADSDPEPKSEAEAEPIRIVSAAYKAAPPKYLSSMSERVITKKLTEPGKENKAKRGETESLPPPSKTSSSSQIFIRHERPSENQFDAAEFTAPEDSSFVSSEQRDNLLGELVDLSMEGSSGPQDDMAIGDSMGDPSNVRETIVPYEPQKYTQYAAPPQRPQSPMHNEVSTSIHVGPKRPEYKEINREDRAVNSGSVPVGPKEEQQIRQNDKFLQAPAEKEYMTFRDPKSARDAFQLNEEKAPDGSTHGGFGFVDDGGHLHYIQYKRDQKGHLLESTKETVQNFSESRRVPKKIMRVRKAPKLGRHTKSNSVLGLLNVFKNKRPAPPIKMPKRPVQSQHPTQYAHQQHQQHNQQQQHQFQQSPPRLQLNPKEMQTGFQPIFPGSEGVKTFVGYGNSESVNPFVEGNFEAPSYNSEPPSFNSEAPTLHSEAKTFHSEAPTFHSEAPSTNSEPGPPRQKRKPFLLSGPVKLLGLLKNKTRRPRPPTRATRRPVFIPQQAQTQQQNLPASINDIIHSQSSEEDELNLPPYGPPYNDDFVIAEHLGLKTPPQEESEEEEQEADPLPPFQDNSYVIPPVEKLQPPNFRTTTTTTTSTTTTTTASTVSTASTTTTTTTTTSTFPPRTQPPRLRAIQAEIEQEQIRKLNSLNALQRLRDIASDQGRTSTTPEPRTQPPNLNKKATQPPGIARLRQLAGFPDRRRRQDNVWTVLSDEGAVGYQSFTMGADTSFDNFNNNNNDDDDENSNKKRAIPKDERKMTRLEEARMRNKNRARKNVKPMFGSMTHEFVSTQDRTKKSPPKYIVTKTSTPLFNDDSPIFSQNSFTPNSSPFKSSFKQPILVDTKDLKLSKNSAREVSSFPAKHSKYNLVEDREFLFEVNKKREKFNKPIQIQQRPLYKPRPDDEPLVFTVAPKPLRKEKEERKPFLPFRQQPKFNSNNRQPTSIKIPTTTTTTTTPRPTPTPTARQSFRQLTTAIGLDLGKNGENNHKNFEKKLNTTKPNPVLPPMPTFPSHSDDEEGKNRTKKGANNFYHHSLFHPHPVPLTPVPNHGPFLPHHQPTIAPYPHYVPTTVAPLPYHHEPTLAPRGPHYVPTVPPTAHLPPAAHHGHPHAPVPHSPHLPPAPHHGPPRPHAPYNPHLPPAPRLGPTGAPIIVHGPTVTPSPIIHNPGEPRAPGFGPPPEHFSPASNVLHVNVPITAIPHHAPTYTTVHPYTIPVYHQDAHSEIPNYDAHPPVRNHFPPTTPRPLHYGETTNSPDQVSTLAPRPLHYFTATTTIAPRQYGDLVTPSIILKAVFSTADPSKIPIIPDHHDLGPPPLPHMVDAPHLQGIGPPPLPHMVDAPHLQRGFPHVHHHGQPLPQPTFAPFLNESLSQLNRPIGEYNRPLRILEPYELLDHLQHKDTLLPAKLSPEPFFPPPVGLAEGHSLSLSHNPQKPVKTSSLTKRTKPKSLQVRPNVYREHEILKVTPHGEPRPLAYLPAPKYGPTVHPTLAQPTVSLFPNPVTKVPYFKNPHTHVTPGPDPRSKTFRPRIIPTPKAVHRRPPRATRPPVSRIASRPVVSKLPIIYDYDYDYDYNEADSDAPDVDDTEGSGSEDNMNAELQVGAPPAAEKEQELTADGIPIIRRNLKTTIIAKDGRETVLLPGEQIDKDFFTPRAELKRKQNEIFKQTEVKAPSLERKEKALKEEEKPKKKKTSSLAERMEKKLKEVKARQEKNGPVRTRLLPARIISKDGSKKEFFPKEVEIEEEKKETLKTRFLPARIISKDGTKKEFFPSESDNTEANSEVKEVRVENNKINTEVRRVKKVEAAPVRSGVQLKEGQVPANAELRSGRVQLKEVRAPVLKVIEENLVEEEEIVSSEEVTEAPVESEEEYYEDESEEEVPEEEYEEYEEYEESSGDYEEEEYSGEEEEEEYEYVEEEEAESEEEEVQEPAPSQSLVFETRRDYRPLSESESRFEGSERPAPVVQEQARRSFHRQEKTLEYERPPRRQPEYVEPELSEGEEVVDHWAIQAMVDDMEIMKVKQ